MDCAQAPVTSCLDMLKVHPEYQLNSCGIARVTVTFPVSVLPHLTCAGSQSIPPSDVLAKSATTKIDTSADIMNTTR